MRTRPRLLAALALALVVALTAAVAAPAALHHGRAATPAAAQQGNVLKNIAMTGKARNGTPFKGTFTVHRFVVRRVHGNRAVYALGTLRGKLGSRTVHRRSVMIPVSVGGATTSQLPTPPAASCPILHLDLGPLHLNLLGLHVNLSRVVLDITAVPGAGNLLGNLLCGVANLLNNNPVTGRTLADLLNSVADLLRGA